MPGLLCSADGALFNLHDLPQRASYASFLVHCGSQICLLLSGHHAVLLLLCCRLLACLVRRFLVSGLLACSLRQPALQNRKRPLTNTSYRIIISFTPRPSSRPRCVIHDSTGICIVSGNHAAQVRLVSLPICTVMSARRHWTRKYNSDDSLPSTRWLRSLTATVSNH